MTYHCILPFIATTALLLAGCTAPIEAPDPESPYVDQLDSPIRGLDPGEIDNLLAGNGAGFARAAELNGYPGPRHVIDLADELELSEEQLATFEALFAAMNERARTAGAEVVDAHGALESAFRDDRITPETLGDLTAAVDDAVNRYRTIHLEYHLQARPLLTEHQNMMYQQLRGYADGSHSHPGH